MQFHRFQTRSFTILHIYKQSTAITVAVSIFKFHNSLNWLHYPDSLACKLITLTGKKHTEHIIHCLGSTWIAMRIAASFMTTDVSKLVYYGNFHSIMNYEVIFYGDSTEGKRLFTTQKKVIRIMANAQERELGRSLFKQFSTPPTCQWIHTIITVSEKNM